MSVAWGSARNPDSCCSKGYLKLGLGLFHLETALPTSKPNWPDLVKPGARPGVLEGLAGVVDLVDWPRGCLKPRYSVH